MADEGSEGRTHGGEGIGQPNADTDTARQTAGLGVAVGERIGQYFHIAVDVRKGRDARLSQTVLGAKGTSSQGYDSRQTIVKSNRFPSQRIGCRFGKLNLGRTARDSDDEIRLAVDKEWFTSRRGSRQGEQTGAIAIDAVQLARCPRGIENNSIACASVRSRGGEPDLVRIGGGDDEVGLAFGQPANGATAASAVDHLIACAETVVAA